MAINLAKLPEIAAARRPDLHYVLHNLAANATCGGEREIVLDQRLDALYRYWLGKRRDRQMPARCDIDPLEIPGDIWPHIMLLDVVWDEGAPRFRYRRVGDVFWRSAGREPTGLFINDVLPETAGYRRYVVGIYEEMAWRRRAMYSENGFSLEGRDTQMSVKRISLPLSNDGETVNMVLAAHVFEHKNLTREAAFALVLEMTELKREVLA